MHRVESGCVGFCWTRIRFPIDLTCAFRASTGRHYSLLRFSFSSSFEICRFPARVCRCVGVCVCACVVPDFWASFSLFFFIGSLTPSAAERQTPSRRVRTTARSGDKRRQRGK